MLNPSDRVIVDGSPVAIGEDLAARFRPGDLLFGVDGGAILHVPADVNERVGRVVDRASRAFEELQSCDPDLVTRFFDLFAAALSDPVTVSAIKVANQSDVERAGARGRSTTRLVVTESMLTSMREALTLWRDASERPDAPIETVSHDGWTVESVRAPLGVVAFVFEGRPNVFTDATGVLRTGNACVFRIGSDALDTARTIMELAVRPSLEGAGLPVDSVMLIDEPSHASAWSLFSQPKVSLAVARGSGKAVADLGSVARQSGIPVSLHGTGGAWMMVCSGADMARVRAAVRHSLDRKVCNTLNVVCVVGEEWRDLLGPVVDGIESAARSRDTSAVIHDVTGACSPSDSSTEVRPATIGDLGVEWEWEVRPEVTVVAASSLDEAVVLFNAHSPRFVLSVLSARADDLDRAWRTAKAPFVGDGMTRWVDGQFALRRPELGLANWENGPMIGRGAILSGGDVFTVRYRVSQSDEGLHR